LERLKEIFRQQRIELSLLTKNLQKQKLDSVSLQKSLDERERILLQQEQTIESLERRLILSENESQASLQELRAVKQELADLKILLERARKLLTDYSREALRDKIVIGALMFGAGALLGIVVE
jgi:Leucine-rich repeat (LRR) protein